MDFSGNIYLSTILDLVETLPQEKQDSLTKQLSDNGDNKDELPEIMKEYFAIEQVRQALETSTKKATDKYIKSISSTLCDTQLENLSHVFEKHLPPTNNTPQP